MNSASHQPPACLTLAFDGSVAALTLHHGPMNVIDDVLLNELESAFEAVAANPVISVLRIRSGAGSFPPERIFDWSPSDWQRWRALTR